MSKLPSTYERNRLRQSLIRLGSLLVITLLACGLVSLFSLWSMQRQHVQAEEQHSELLRALNSARSAQVSFKIQVQSWKNLLLRGQDKGEYDNAIREFHLAELSTQENLHTLAVWAQASEKLTLQTEIAHLIREHEEAGTTYQAALPGSGDITKFRVTADGAVRGIDRPINSKLDNLVVEMLKADASTTAMTRQAERQRFDVLSRVIWASMAISLFLVTALLWRTLRDPALHG